MALSQASQRPGPPSPVHLDRPTVPRCSRGQAGANRHRGEATQARNPSVAEERTDLTASELGIKSAGAILTSWCTPLTRWCTCRVDVQRTATADGLRSCPIHAAAPIYIGNGHLCPCGTSGALGCAREAPTQSRRGSCRPSRLTRRAKPWAAAWPLDVARGRGSQPDTRPRLDPIEQIAEPCSEVLGRGVRRQFGGQRPNWHPRYFRGGPVAGREVARAAKPMVYVWTEP